MGRFASFPHLRCPQAQVCAAAELQRGLRLVGSSTLSGNLEHGASFLRPPAVMGIGLPQGYATLFIFANPQLLLISREASESEQRRKR